MQLIKEKNKQNEFTLKGLTLGKLLAIRDALEELDDTERPLGPVAKDVLIFLNHQDLESLWEGL